MPDDTVALELEGSGFQLDDLDALQHFRGLLRELAADAAGGAAITWELRRFGTGSLVAEVQGTAEDQDAVHRVAAAYDCVGAALAVGDPVPYSDAVSAHTDRLTSLIDGRVESLRFRTGGRVREVRHASAAALWKPFPHLESFGAIEGVVETLARRRGRGLWCIPTTKRPAFPATSPPSMRRECPNSGESVSGSRVFFGETERRICPCPSAM